METILKEAKEISLRKYMDLVNPVFIGQTKLDEDDKYWVIFKSDDVLYKIHITL